MQSMIPLSLADIKEVCNALSDRQAALIARAAQLHTAYYAAAPAEEEAAKAAWLAVKQQLAAAHALEVRMLEALAAAERSAA